MTFDDALNKLQTLREAGSAKFYLEARSVGSPPHYVRCSFKGNIHLCPLNVLCHSIGETRLLNWQISAMAAILGLSTEEADLMLAAADGINCWSDLFQGKYAQGKIEKARNLLLEACGLEESNEPAQILDAAAPYCD